MNSGWTLKLLSLYLTPWIYQSPFVLLAFYLKLKTLAWFPMEEYWVKLRDVGEIYRIFLGSAKIYLFWRAVQRRWEITEDRQDSTGEEFSACDKWYHNQYCQFRVIQLTNLSPTPELQPRISSRPIRMFGM